MISCPFCSKDFASLKHLKEHLHWAYCEPYEKILLWQKEPVMVDVVKRYEGMKNGFM